MENELKSHQLPSVWDFWAITVDGGKFAIENMQQFETVEQFYQIFLSLPEITKFNQGGLAVFKKGVDPAWEQNKKGKIIRIENVNDIQFEKLLLLAIGGSIEHELPQIPLLGVYTTKTKRNQSIRTEFWFGPSKDKIDQEKMKQLISTNVGIDSNCNVIEIIKLLSK